MFVGIAKPQNYFQVICLQHLQLPPLHDSKTTIAKGLDFFLHISIQPDGVKMIKKQNPV